MRCFECGSSMNHRESSAESRWGNYSVEIQGAAFLQCEDCGAKTFDPGEAKMLQHIVAGIADSSIYPKPEKINIRETAPILKLFGDNLYTLIKEEDITLVKHDREYSFSRRHLLEMLTPR